MAKILYISAYLGISISAFTDIGGFYLSKGFTQEGPGYIFRQTRLETRLLALKPKMDSLYRLGLSCILSHHETLKTTKNLDIVRI